MSLRARVATGRITGRLTGSTPRGQLVPGGPVKAVNIQTNVETSTRSSSEGIFDLQNLIPGQYRVLAEVSGFKNFRRARVELPVGDTLSLNISPAGRLPDWGTVTVTADAPLLESSSAATGQVVDSRSVWRAWPLPASNPIVTAVLAVRMSMKRRAAPHCAPDANNQG